MMNGHGQDSGADSQFLRIWQNALEDYKAQTSHDLTRLNGVTGAGDLYSKMTVTEKQFKAARKGGDGYQKTREILQACVLPLEALSSVASSAISLTPFAPAATVFGAGMYLIEACNSVSNAYDFVADLLDECKKYIDRLEEYSDLQLGSKFIIKLTSILKFILEVFAQCEEVMDRGRAKLWLDKAFRGQGKDEILKSSLKKLRRDFNDEEMFTITQIYKTEQQTASNVSLLVDTSRTTRVQNMIETLPIGPFNLIAKQAEDNAKSRASPPVWIDMDKAYQAWINEKSPDYRWLWGLGGIGVGKTSLVSYLTARLQVVAKLSNSYIQEEYSHSRKPSNEKPHPLPNRAVALFYGDYETKDEQRPDYVFQCLMRQLLQQLQAVAIDRAVVHCDHIETFRESTKSTSSVTWTSLLDDLAGEFQQTFILVDALDKEEAGYEALIWRLDQLKSPSVKLLVTSRDEPSMRDDAIFRRAILMTIRADPNLIRLYVRERLGRIREVRETNETIGASALPKVLSKDTQFDRIVDLIVNNAHCNFYYAEVQINSLIGERSPVKIEEKLTRLTTSLSDVIRFDVERVREQRDEYKRDAGLKTLMFVAFAGRTPTIDELRHAVVLLLHPSTQESDRALQSKVSSITKDFLIESSSGLLKVDDRTKTVHIDEVIKNYCIDSNIFPEAQYEIAEACLNFLDRRSFSLRCKSQEEYLARRQEHPFYEYAGRFWGFHVGRAGESRFFGPSSPVPLFTLLNRKLFVNAVAAAIREDLQNLRTWNWAGNDTWRAMQDGADPVVRALHLLTYFDLPRTADWWLRKRPNDVDRRSATGTTPLYLACLLNRVRIVDVLLFDYHAKPDLKGSPPSGYNLAAAVFSQSVEIVERLLYANSKETLELGNWHGRRPLSEAVTRGDLNIVRKIIDACLAAPNGEELLTSGENDGWTALHEIAAAPQPSIEAMKLLVEAKGGKAFLGRHTKKWRDTPLHLAAIRGKHEAVEALLNLGADPNLRQSLGKTPLMLAVEGNYENNQQVIRILMAATKDYRLTDKDGNTIWHLAASHGRESVLKLLIQLTPESLFNVKNKHGMTPIRLITVIRRNKWRISIENLIKGCPGQLESDDAYAVLHTLINDRHENTVRVMKVLLEHPVDQWPLARGNTTILHKVVHHGSLEAVKMTWDLIGSKSILEYHDAGGSTALILATVVSAVDKSLFLLDKGADTDARDNNGHTVLHWAIHHDLPALTANLLDRGASYRIKNYDGLTAIDKVAQGSKCESLPQVIAAKHSLAEESASAEETIREEQGINEEERIKVEESIDAEEVPKATAPLEFVPVEQ